MISPARPRMTAKRLERTLEVARAQGMRVRWAPDGSWLFEPLSENYSQADDQPLVEDKEIVL
jgi:hypothetical protein